MAIGFRINARQRQVDRETVEKFRSIAVANVSDSMNRMEHGGRTCDRSTAAASWPASRLP